MKRIICLITALCLVFGSFSFVFADEWGSSQITSVVNNVSSINTTLSNIYTRVNTITNYLTDSNHSVAYWTSAIASWMSPIYNALTSNLSANIGLDVIQGLLGYPVTVQGGGTTWHSYLNEINSILTGTTYTLFPLTLDSDQNIIFGTTSTTTNAVTAIINRLYYIEWAISHWNNQFNYRMGLLSNGYGSTQSLVSFADPDSTVTFTPLSATDGIYKYLNAINTPLARLGYVLASDSRIEAQEAAAANEQAVVDNFIDSSGAGSASPSDIESISDLSSGYQNNFGSSASVTGIFNIFDSNNFGWFSQETANQLDTSSNNSRAKSGFEFETPLLDQRINDIYDALGVKP